MKNYRACTIRIDNAHPMNAGGSVFDAKRAAHTHQLTKLAAMSEMAGNNKSPAPFKKQLGKGSYKTVYMIEGEPPAHFKSLDSEYVLAKLHIKEKENIKENENKYNMDRFIAATLQDVISQMIVLGQYETTVFFSNMDQYGNPCDSAYRYCVYMEKISGKEWKIKDYTVKQNVQFAGRIYEQLKSFHGRGFYHSDVKPGNIMIVNNDARLIDFGGLNRIWNEYRVSTPRYNPFYGNKARGRTFWESLLNRFSESGIIDRIDFPDLAAEFQEKLNELNDAIKYGDVKKICSADLSRINEKGKLRLMYGVYMDMGSLYMMISEIISSSSDSKVLQLNHDEILWESCIRDFFSPKAIKSLLNDLDNKLAINRAQSNVFNNIISGADGISVEWAPYYGINLNDMSNDLFRLENAYAQAGGAQQPDRVEVSLGLESLNDSGKTFLAKEIKCLQYILRPIAASDSGGAKKSNTKGRALLVVYSALANCGSRTHLKTILERFLYVALINRHGSGLFIRHKQITDTFGKIYDRIIECDRNPMQDENKRPILNDKQSSKLVASVLGFEDHLDAFGNVEMFYNAFKESQHGKGYDFVFNWIGHQGRAEQIIECIERDFTYAGGNRQFTRQALKRNNRGNVKLKDAADPNAADVEQKAYALHDYTGKTNEIVQALFKDYSLKPENYIAKIQGLAEILYA
ncbi:hypothetical protein F6R98_00475 [Candidatus Methylospira mobilis]|uniref:Protein kinase domain-containing protein n=1 Tax=Candidatus Methylospira mobilis TaxID=1808979 RepID=A0A5Q0BHH6_9GAMM|nr:hypothetical protein [Candidatus Methylospira mobilis]QFY41276.1 hypothetical protein F6R98_00475 [Candidatus Methylospira mobilis]WNV05502.1 hypothetical protein RP726_03570 [Candidatus Methylospira mobilis]